MTATPPRAHRCAQAFTRAFKGAMAAMRRMRGREIHQPGELSYAQYGLLFGLSDGAAQSARELALRRGRLPRDGRRDARRARRRGARRAGRGPPMTSGSCSTTLTDRGKSLVEERRARYEPRWRAAFDEFSEEELLTAARVVESLHELFDGLAESEPED